MIQVRRFRQAFTLLELIIVIIIVGVLTALALPRFFRTVEFSRSTEGIQFLRTIRNGVERCYLMRGDYGACCSTPLNFQALGLDDIGTIPNSHFNSWVDCVYGSNRIFIIVTRNTRDLVGTDPGGGMSLCGGGSFGVRSRIGLCQDNTTNTIEIRGSGLYDGLSIGGN